MNNKPVLDADRKPGSSAQRDILSQQADRAASGTQTAKSRLGDVLVEQGNVTQEDIVRAIAVQQESKQLRLGEILLQSGCASKQSIAAAIAQVQGVPAADCPPESIAPEALASISRSVAIRCSALPLALKDNQLIVAMAEPQNLVLLDELRFVTGIDISPRFSFRADIVKGIEKFYGGAEKDVSSAEQDSEEEAESPWPGEPDTGEIEFITSHARDENREAMKELHAGMRQRTFAVRLVSMILLAAAQRGASDVHIEPRVGNTFVRFRIDGMLRDFTTIPSAQQASVVSRIKILADMDIAERRVPQDGRFLMICRGRRLDLRVSSLPTYFGEKMVMRILDPRSTLITFRQLGLSEQHTDAVTNLLAMPQGMFIVTGPTGSGKSTTLYAALNLIRSPVRNIITVEDPVEYMLDGINQVQVRPRAGLTFASCLPSILRQDPDVVMIGEIRDAETAEIALKAAQTGHLVLSTLHTNDSIAAITRLLDLGIPAYLIGSVNGVLGQRLLRRLCTCRKEATPDAEFQRRLAVIGCNVVPNSMYEPVGCTACDKTGYKGRVGIYEVLPVEGAVREAIYSECGPEEIRGLARSNGFVSMREDALEKVKQGLTTPEEVMRVVPLENFVDLRCGNCAHQFAPSFLFCPFCGSPRPAPSTHAVEEQRERAPHLVQAG